MKSFNVMALDANFQIISLIRYTSIQWNRKWHESGNFSVEIPLEQFSNSIKYIYTKDRPEMGKVTQINFINQGGYKSIHLSGYFLEYELNRRIVYQSLLSNVYNNPTWDVQKSNAESVAYAFFNAFKDLRTYAWGYSADEWTSYLGIESSTNNNRGKIAEHTRNGEKLGDKVYNILKPSGLSYRVSYNFQSSKKIFSVCNGIDRTDGQSSNNQVVFSTKYGNIKNPNVLIDEGDYKNSCIVHSKFNRTTEVYVDPDHSVSQSEDVEYTCAFMNRTPGVSYDDSFSYAECTAECNNEDFENSPYEKMKPDSDNEIAECAKTINVEFDALEGSYEYGEDFDIGDVVNIEINEIGLSATARLIGCSEVVKSGTWSMTMEFGTPLIKK